MLTMVKPHEIPLAVLPVLAAEEVSSWYGDTLSLRSVNMKIPERAITAIIGPSGCGKSTFLRLFNRMNDVVPGFRMSGRVLYKGSNLYTTTLDPATARTKIGMVFQKPNPFPGSILKNVTWGPRINGYKENLNELAESSLKKAALWDEVKDKLHQSGLALSGGQQQRLCIARALAMQPDVILMDEPASALDPVSTAKIEELITELKDKHSIVIVTHNMQQAARISDWTAFFLQGELIEFDRTRTIFGAPSDRRTEDYINGRFG